MLSANGNPSFQLPYNSGCEERRFLDMQTGVAAVATKTGPIYIRGVLPIQ